ncbi:MAG: hypothetical protein AAGK14_04710 [Verrucomicrobiota bacterium]
MIRNLIEKDWDQIRRQLQMRYPHLGPADLLYVRGQEDALIWRLKQKTRLSEAELAKFMEDAVLATH